MSHTVCNTLEMDGILAINSLGGPPLPLGHTDLDRVKITLANQAATDIQRWQVNVATLVSNRIPNRVIRR